MLQVVEEGLAEAVEIERRRLGLILGRGSRWCCEHGTGRTWFHRGRGHEVLLLSDKRRW